MTSFKKILIPVDFSLGTEIAVRKAMGLLDPKDPEIHLQHVVKNTSGATAKFNMWEAEKKLSQWKTTIQESVDGIKVTTGILPGSSVTREIVDSAKLLSPDLIVIGKQGDKRWWPFSDKVSPDQIAKNSNCPVLTVKPGSIHKKTKIIVVPVSHFVPERKLELAVLIARRCRARIHLLAIQDTGKGHEPGLSDSFLAAYNQLREHLHNPVEYLTISTRKFARTALHYAESVMADMILVNPETESGIFTLTGSRHISDLIGCNSNIQVLDVQS
ncbi:MAG: universal stress protein [Puia sp.]|nr:universal stress protein [Puia sp.]